MAIQTIDIGDHVECDMCGKDFTGSDDPGGFLFHSQAVGPCCAARVESDAKRYGEESPIRGRCTPGMAFAAWVLALRGGENTIRILTGDDFEAATGMPSGET